MSGIYPSSEGGVYVKWEKIGGGCCLGCRGLEDVDFCKVVYDDLGMPVGVRVKDTLGLACVLRARKLGLQPKPNPLLRRGK